MKYLEQFYNQARAEGMPEFSALNETQRAIYAGTLSFAVYSLNQEVQALKTTLIDQLKNLFKSNQ